MLRKIGRAALIGILGIVGFIVLAILAAFLWLHTGTGADELGRFAANEARNAIAGDLRLKGIHVGGFLHVCIDQVDLRDPEEHEVLTAERVCVKLKPLALRSHHIDITELELIKPRLEIDSIPGTKDTTLSRAIAARKPTAQEQAAQSTPFAWIIEVESLSLQQGSVTLRPALPEKGKAPPAATFALDALQIWNAHALYAADAAAAALNLSAQLSAPGRARLAIDLDATVKGPPATGLVTINTLHVHAGESGLALSGSWDLAHNSGELHATDIVAVPTDVEALMPAHEGPPLLAGTVHGSLMAKSDGKSAQAELHLDLPKGKVQARATATLEAKPRWDLQLTANDVDPGAVSGLAPHGLVDARVSIHGKDRPQFDAHGVSGQLEGVVHIGPARLDRVGELNADLAASIEGRQGLVKAFSASALGLKLRAHGEAAYDALKLDTNLEAPDLAAAARAIGVLTKQPPLPLAGSLAVAAHVTGSPRRPNADLHLRAPKFRFGPTLDVAGLRVDGNLHGDLAAPDGALTINAQRMLAGAIDLGRPTIAMNLEWPVAHLRIDAGVIGGQLKLAGDATIDDDKDGLILSNFAVSWPGNELRLVRKANIHFRDEIIVEPIELRGQHGSVRLQAQVLPPPGRIDASLVLSQFDLAFLPEFALPKNTGLHGIVDASALLLGPRAAPDIDVKLAVKGLGANAIGEVKIDTQAHAHVHEGRLAAAGRISSGSLLALDFQAQAPIEKFGESAEVSLDAHLAPVDLEKLAQQAKLAPLLAQKIRGTVELHLAAQGTLGNPRAHLSFSGRKLGNDVVQDVDLRGGALLEKNRLTLDAETDLAGEKVLALSAQAPFELLRALREKTYLRSATNRSLQAELVITQLQLERLAKTGYLPPNSAGSVSAALRLSGTPMSPQLSFFTAGENVSAGRLRGLGFQGQLDLGEKLKLSFGAQSGTDVVATLTANASLSGAEVVELGRRKDDPDAIAELLGRPVSFTLDIPGLPIARASALAGSDKAIAEGRVAGRISLTGSPARPRLAGTISLKDLARKDRKLGAADLHIEAGESGALVHLGVQPPGGGSLDLHAQLKADLGARTLLRDGLDGVMSAPFNAEATAKHLDLAFLGGLAPLVRRAGGVLELEAKVTGTLAKPVPNGELHLKGGLFDIVGQGTYDDVAADMTFSPKEVVVDRITGSTGPGTFSVVLAASRKLSGDDDVADTFEFSGEVHLGDAESVRDRKRADGSPLPAGAVPVRQAGEQRADVTAELDLFGDYSDGLLHATAKIPEAKVVIDALPDKKLPKLAPNDDVEIVRAGEKPHPPGEKAPDDQKAASNLRVHAKLEIVHLYVKAADFEFPVESSLTFDYDAQHPDEPSADGVIHVPTGSFNALGRRFSIVDAKITETGGDITDPELEIKALFENPQANVTITVSGTAQDPQLDMSSTPAMDQDAIAFFLATGHIQGRATQSGGGVDLSGAATSVLGSLLFGEVRKELASVLPVDVLTIETGAQGVSEASVGKYIGDRVFIGYRQRLQPAPNENTSEGRIEYEISRAVSAEATVGDRNSDISVLYTHDF